MTKKRLKTSKESLTNKFKKMLLKEKINSDLKEALKAGNAEKRDTLRFIVSAIKNAEIEKIKKEEGLNDEEVIEVVSRQIKQRKDSVEQYKKGNRPDLAEKENKEIEILLKYLPKQLSEEEIRKEVKKTILQIGASSANFGKIMGEAMRNLKGKADGNAVKKILQEELSG